MSEQTLDGLSESGRDALALAREEADRLGHNFVGSEHLLLGLLRQDETVARVLGDLGVTPERARDAVVAVIGRGEHPHVGETQLTPRAWHAVDLARLEARWMRKPEVGPEHLVLGLLREGEGIAAGVLESLGVGLRRLRLALQNADPRFRQGPPPGTPPAAWTRVSGGASVSPTTTLYRAEPTPPPLGELRRVVPVAQTRVDGGTALTLLSLEVYGDGFLVHVRLVPSRDRVVEPGSFLRPELSPEAVDDAGRRRAAGPIGGTGGGHEWRFQFVFAPALDPATRELRLIVQEIRWLRLDREHRTWTSDDTEPGPWTFAVDLAAGSA